MIGFQSHLSIIFPNLSSWRWQDKVEIICRGSKVWLNGRSWWVPQAETLVRMSSRKSTQSRSSTSKKRYLVVDAGTLVVGRWEVNKTPLTPGALCCVQHRCDSNFLQNTNKDLLINLNQFWRPVKTWHFWQRRHLRWKVQAAPGLKRNICEHIVHHSYYLGLWIVDCEHIV